ncbi:MAG: Re/Si-specific NAD(P)(+) transhydrogenase subunit alpha [Alphaproteobacteria bacterium]|nr:Re/Si-specific NAD(P)(+) transhydrogenase subunit alpha [Alphaproteobacteria bacterium]
MKVVVPRERRAHERRVAATPDTVKRMVGMGWSVAVERGAGESAALPDAQYQQAGATLLDRLPGNLGEADVLVKVQRPMTAAEGNDELLGVKRGAMVVGLLAPGNAPQSLSDYAAKGVTAIALELLPRITRAQNMDALSSQSNLAGYRAVIDAAAELQRALPMMMTAAGTIAPAKVMVLGAGVAGLQAIATARRLGAVVLATDVRPAAKEQVESLGAKFVMVESEETKTAETAGGYAREMSEDYRRRQEALVRETLAKQDIAITTALIPGRRAPILITADMVKSMRPGSVIVDLAAEQGGNCELTRPGDVAEVDGVRIIGHLNVPSRVPTDASMLYARNVLNFLTPLVDKDSRVLKVDWNDEILKATVLTRDGAVVHPQFQGKS